MKTQRDASKTVRMRCPKCGETIETTTTETMVYCLNCRRWCREEEPSTPPPQLPAKPVKKRNRCH